MLNKLIQIYLRFKANHNLLALSIIYLSSIVTSIFLGATLALNTSSFLPFILLAVCVLFFIDALSVISE